MKYFKFAICLFFAISVYGNIGYEDLVLPSPAPNSNLPKGYQILHRKTRNKPYWENEQAKKFVELYLQDAVKLESDADAMRFASDSVTLKGAYIELGVCLGRTINFLAALNPKEPIYGFDSFEGLPEDWVREDYILPKGTFALKNPEKRPFVLGNVELVSGWFKDTLPIFAKEKLEDQPVAFIHVDCDVYTSTAEALHILGPYIQEGTIVLLDELYNYPGYEKHEWKAMTEFLDAGGWKAEYLAYNIYHEQVVLRIKK